ncbi:MAG: putative AGC family protein kinase [Streblomastix strix]|uniref:Putative AGC family protein kinase n=1 Tax=Streblomastix strix TaxID=222440 RepID=A0A5J4VHH1_9EUKA|nr:MAG: putative AGC family protein kinase [Streblomastix strix]
MHAKNIIHRDVKLGNIFLTKEQNVKLGDFGSAIQLQRQDKKIKSKAGTRVYKSPEMLKSKEKRKYGFKTDIWSLGIAIYELCKKERPYHGDSDRQMRRSIKRDNIARIPDRYSDGLWKLILKMLNKNPKKRPSAEEILNQTSRRRHSKIDIQKDAILIKECG